MKHIILTVRLRDSDLKMMLPMCFGFQQIWSNIESLRKSMVDIRIRLLVATESDEINLRKQPLSL